MGKPILCLDFDGVVHHYISPWQGTHIISDMPTPGAISFMHHALQFFDVQIYSSRSLDPLGIEAMKTWLQMHSGPLWEDTPDRPGIKNVKFPTSKPAATVSLDDRALTFIGIWPSMGQLLSFRPWNRPIGRN